MKQNISFSLKNVKIDAGIKNLNDPSAFIEYSDTVDDVYNNIDDYNPKRKRKILIVFDDMIADIMTNKRFQAIIKELFIRFIIYYLLDDSSMRFRKNFLDSSL